MMGFKGNLYIILSRESEWKHLLPGRQVFWQVFWQDCTPATVKASGALSLQWQKVFFFSVGALLGNCYRDHLNHQAAFVLKKKKKSKPPKYLVWKNKEWLVQSEQVSSQALKNNLPYGCPCLKIQALEEKKTNSLLIPTTGIKVTYQQWVHLQPYKCFFF